MALIEELAKTLHIEIETPAVTSYNTEFVSQIIDGQRELEAGKGTIVPLEKLWK